MQSRGQIQSKQYLNRHFLFSRTLTTTSTSTTLTTSTTTGARGGPVHGGGPWPRPPRDGQGGRTLADREAHTGQEIELLDRMEDMD